MLKAGSLFYAVLIALLIALVSSSLLLYGYFQQRLHQRFLERDRLLLNAASGMNLVLSTSDYQGRHEVRRLDLFGENRDSVKIRHHPWGVYEVAVITAFHKRQQFTKAALVGFTRDTTERLAIYLTDQNRPLSLCGKTFINGDCYLPEAGVKRAYIEGQSFTGNRLIHGQVRKSQRKLPELNQQLLEHNLDLLSFESTGVKAIYADGTDQEVRHSFDDSTLYIMSHENLFLDNQDLKGNLAIICSKEVHISADTRLEDVLVYASGIIVEAGFRGKVQLFARDSILVGSGCKFLFPSALSLFKTGSSIPHPFLRIGEDSRIEGQVLAYQQQLSRDQPRVSLEKKAVIEGDLIVQGLLDLKGSVHGSVICQKFTLKTPSSIYENHLLNVSIDPVKLSRHYVGGAVMPTGRKNIVKWVF